MISEQALARLKASDLSTEKIAAIFGSLAELLAMQPQAENVSYAVGYSRDDELQPGEAVPLINFVLARHMPTELNSEDE